jgi:hypothetical protein
MRLSDLRSSALVLLFVSVSLAACASIAGDFTTHPEDAGAGEDASVDASSDSPVEAQEGNPDSTAGDSASKTDTGATDGATHADASTDGGSDAATCNGTLCGSSCVDTQTNAQNCGTCGNDCAMLPHVASATGVTCSSGICSIPATSCEMGYAHCTSNPQDGCETSLSSSQSCGTCTTVCSGNTSLCQLSGSVDAGGTYGCVSSCSGSTPDLCGATCTNTQTDPQNCNMCGSACPVVTGGGNATCNAGVCGVSCQSGEHQCGTTTMCALDTDTSHCGASCVACSAPTGGSVSCTGGACQQSCPGSDSICSGACVDTTSNPAFCGNCTTACSAPKSACSSSVCSCPAGTPTFCSSNNTCVNTTNDPLNCGGCGHSCQGGACSSGVCQPTTIYTRGAFESLGGLYGITVTNGAPDQLLLVNCVSGGDPTLEITTGASPSHVFGGTSNASYCGRTIAGGELNVYYGTDNGSAGNGAVWYNSWFSSWGTPTRMDNGSIAGSILTIVEGTTGILDFDNAATTNNLCELPVGGSGSAPTCVTVTAAGGGAVHGMELDGNSVEILVACPTAGKIAKYDSGNLGTQSTWLASGVGSPWDIHVPGDTYIYWSDHTNGAMYRNTLSNTTPVNLTSSLPSGKIPTIEAPDGFFVDIGSNRIYFWNRNSGNIWWIASNGTSTAMNNVAANPSGIGAVAQDGTSIYWSVEGTNPSVMQLAK